MIVPLAHDVVFIHMTISRHASFSALCFFCIAQHLEEKNNLKHAPPIQVNNGEENIIKLFHKIEQLVGAQYRDFF
jgi:hypothetical protein